MQSKFIGEPGRRTLLRGVRFICHPKCKTRYTALYQIDSSTPQQREHFAAHVGQMIAGL